MGQVNLQSNLAVGLNWYFKPGPAHLDTCEFFIRCKTNNNKNINNNNDNNSDDLLLKYVGFIDRGQRIESRFSRNPIRMTGRVLSIVNSEFKGSSRFIMILNRK
jgi:hypothetical protein